MDRMASGGILGTVLQNAADSGTEASNRLSMVIIGLLGLALLIAVVTVVFWRLTRPDPVVADTGIRWIPAADSSASATPAERSIGGDAAAPEGPEGAAGAG